MISGFAFLIQERCEQAQGDELKALIRVLLRNTQRMKSQVDELLAVTTPGCTDGRRSC